MSRYPVYVTGNEQKARYFADMIGLPIERVAVDVSEIQSLSLREIVEHKAKEAYELLQQPVIVEDTALWFSALGNLPGPLIKWFLQELDADGLCQLLNSFTDRSARAGAAIAVYDGVDMTVFESEIEGSIVDEPKGASGFGWNMIFIPDGSDKTLGEMDETTFKSYYQKVKPFRETARFLREKY